MEDFGSLVRMGGYAAYVWPAYGLTLTVLAAVLVASVRAARRRESELAAAQSLRPARRRVAAALPAEAPPA